MTDTLRIKRRLLAGGPGVPVSLANAELAYNEASHTLYYGEGTGGSGGSATTVVPIGGRGAFLPLSAADPVNVKISPYNAVGNGVADDTAAIQAAINTGLSVYLPKGTYKITSQINCANKAQRITGAGRNATFISVTGPSAGFVAGIFNVTSLEVGPSFAEFCVMCAQPDTSSRASLNVYPPVFYLDVTPRCQFTNVRMVGGLNGIYMNGNCGGFRASGCDFGCYSVNIYIDGNVDVTSFTDCQVWCFSATGIMTTNQQKIFWDANCYGIYSRRNDYLDWKGGLFMVGVSAMFDTGTRSDFPGSTYGHFTGTGFDSFGGLGVAAGTILTDNCTFSVGGDPNNIRSNNAVIHTGGNVTIRGAKFFVGNTALIPNQALIWTGCGSGVAMMIVEACEFEMGGANVRAIYAETSNNAYDSITIANNKFTRLAGFSYTVGAVEIKGGSGTFTGNTCGPAAGSMTGTVPALGFPAGIGTWFTANNNFHGWASTVTGSSTTAQNLLQLPPVVGDAMPIVQVNGNATIGGMTYLGEIGASPAFAGILTTLYFAGVCTVNAGSFGVAGQFLLNNGAALTTRTGTHLTVRLSTTGNWVEVGRCV